MSRAHPQAILAYLLLALRSAMMLTLGAALLVGASRLARAEVQIRKGGSSWAVLEDSGTIRIGGSSVGSFERDGTVRKKGSSIGSVDPDGTIRRSGSSVGKVDEDGTLRKSGSSFARIESGGTIRMGGSSWGSASSCCGDFGAKRAVAAVLVFFAPDFYMHMF